MIARYENVIDVKIPQFNYDIHLIIFCTSVESIA